MAVLSVFHSFFKYNTSAIATLVLSTLLLSLCLIVSIRWIEERWRVIKLASLIPGPSSLPLFGNSISFAVDPVRSLETLSKFLIRFDRGLFKLWMGPKLSVIVTRPSDIEIVLGNTKQFTKSQQYNALKPLMGEGLFTASSMEKWKLNRKLVTPGFHFSILKGFITIFHQEAEILADKFEATLGKPVDVQMYIAMCTLDAICRTAMGISIKAQRGHNVEFVRNMDILLKTLQQRIANVWYLIPMLFAMSSLKKANDKAIKAALNFTCDVIQKRKELWEKDKQGYHRKLEEGGKLAFLDLMLGTGMADSQLRDETITIIMGGQETTATELSFALLLLAIRKDIQEKVHKELDVVFGESNRNSMPSLHDLSKLEYLERFIKEVMRLYPALPLFGRCLESDLQVGKYLIPEGTDVGLFVFQTHRDPEHWNNPELFDPDRFSPEKCRARHPYSFLPFSAGLRNCIGQKYAMLQMKIVLSTILQRFNLTPGPEHKTIDDIEIIMTTTLKSRKGFNVIFNNR